MYHCSGFSTKYILQMFFINLQGLCSANRESWKAAEEMKRRQLKGLFNVFWDLDEYSPLCQNISMNGMYSVVAVLLAVVAMSTSCSAQAACNVISSGGFLRQSLRIDAYNSPCVIHNDLIIGARAALTVDPGVTLQFSPGVMLGVNGTLIARVSFNPYFLLLITSYCNIILYARLKSCKGMTYSTEAAHLHFVGLEPVLCVPTTWV